MIRKRIVRRRGYRTVRLDLAGRRLKLFTSGKVASAWRELKEKLDVWQGSRLGILLEAVYERGKLEGRAEVIQQLDDLKASIPHRLPGRPPKSN